MPERVATLEERSLADHSRLTHVEDVVDGVVERVAHLQGRLIGIGAVIGILAGVGTALAANHL